MVTCLIYRIIKLSVVSLFAIAVNFYSCKSQTSKNELSLSGIKLYYNINMNIDGSNRNMYSDIDIYYYKDLVMLKIPSIAEHSVTFLNKNLDVVKEQSKIDTLYAYHIYKNNSATGGVYDALDATSSKVFSVDSLLKQKAFKGGIHYNEKLDSLVAKETLKDKLNTNVIKFVHKNDIASKSYDSLYLYSSDKLKNVNYSFSEALDDKFNSKIYKIELIVNEIQKVGPQDMFVPKRSIIFGFIPNGFNEHKSIIALFERFDRGK